MPGLRSRRPRAVCRPGLTGSIRGRVRGQLDDPQVTGDVRADRLRYAGFDFKGGELSVNYRGGGRRRGLGRGPGEPAARGRRAGQGLAFRVGSRTATARPGTGPLGTRRISAGAGPGPGESLLLATGRLQGSGQLLDPGSIRVDCGWTRCGFRPPENRCRTSRPCGSPGATRGSWWMISGWPANNTTSRSAGAGAAPRVEPAGRRRGESLRLQGVLAEIEDVDGRGD